MHKVISFLIVAIVVFSSSMSFAMPCMSSHTEKAVTTTSSSTMERPDEISIIARQFEFVPEMIVVTKGKPVKLYLTSLDVAHGISLKAFNINKKVEKGELAVIEFTPDKAGVFEFKCSVYCGSGHSDMKGKLVVDEMMHGGQMMMGTSEAGEGAKHMHEGHMH